jgi:membrane-bound lytic murein transglycosylase MltF
MSSGKDRPKNLEEVARRKAQLDEEIKRIHESEEEKKHTIPPPEDLDRRKEELDFTKSLKEGNVRNTERELIRGKLLTVLLILAAIGVFLWCYRALQQYGLL